jgi:hypothetical protein
MPAYTSDQLAAAIIAEGQAARTTGPAYLHHPAITPKGIVIALATALVESNLTMYANPADPESEQYPHDAEGHDHLSSGDFQQQPPWWGTAAERMDPWLSAAMFFRSLAAQRIDKQDYNTDANSPGGWAQMVQGSSFPDRYDKRIGDAQAIYDRLSGGLPPVPASDPNKAALDRLGAVRPDFNEYPLWVSRNFQDRNGTVVDLLLGHTEESSGYDNADGLARYLESTTNSGNPVSYHRTISKGQHDDGITVVDVVPITKAAWAVGNSNNRSINTCFAGSSVKWSRQQWIDNVGRGFDVWAYLNVRDAVTLGWKSCPVIPGPNYDADPPGVSDHRYCSDYLQDGNDHTDMGDNVPWDLIEAAVVKYWAVAYPPGGDAPPPPAAPQTFAEWVKSATDRELLEYVVMQLGPGDPTWTSTDDAKDTLRDFLWRHLATAAAKARAAK